MKAHQREYVIVPSVGIQAVRELISSFLVNIVAMVIVRVALESQKGLNVIVPTALRYNFAVISIIY